MSKADAKTKGFKPTQTAEGGVDARDQPNRSVNDMEPAKFSNKDYEAELARLNVELVKLQEWIRHKGLKVVVLFEGRDAAGKSTTTFRPL